MVGLIVALVNLVWYLAMIAWLLVAAFRYDELPNAAHFQTLALVLLLLCWGSQAKSKVTD